MLRSLFVFASRRRHTRCSGVSWAWQAEDGIRDAQESRGLGDVYKRQALGGGPPSFPQGFTCLVVLWIRSDRFSFSFTGLLPSAEQLSSYLQLRNYDIYDLSATPVSYTHLRAHETPEHLV